MFVGHATLAFGLAGLVGYRFGDRRLGLVLGVAAGLFAAVPDVDVLYALAGPLAVGPAAPFTLAEAFWSASTVTHRTVTHSLVLAVPATVAFAAWSDRPRAAGALLLAVVSVVAWASGPLAALVAGSFVVAGAVVAGVAAGLGLDVRQRGVAALVGLLTHPFGDLFTGSPPPMLYPLDASLVDARVAPFADPTANLLGAFGVELLAIWFGLCVALLLCGRRPGPHLDRRAAVGAAYGVAALVLEPPTMDVSYHFVFSVLAVGAVATPGRRLLGRRLTRETALDVAVTGLAAVSAAWAGYVLVYALW